MFSYRIRLSCRFSIISQTALISRFEKMLSTFGNFPVINELIRPHGDYIYMRGQTGLYLIRFPYSLYLPDPRKLASTIAMIFTTFLFMFYSSMPSTAVISFSYFSVWAAASASVAPCTMV